ncbi:MAG TPA: molybdopterin-dependent oxidoreductase [Bacteroidota bacterium]|nr:molybdopterin-dependent oxidoreductase [Bacteroidota bacterium]
MKSTTRRRFIQLIPALIFVGCDMTPGEKVGGFLKSFQSFTDWVQGKVFSPDKLAPEYSEDQVTPESGFRVNGYDTDTPDIDIPKWQLTIDGLVSKPGTFALETIKAMPVKAMNTRHVCVEGWSMIPKWKGTPLRGLLEAAGADPTAKYLSVKCGDDYYTCYDMGSAMHAQTLLAYEAYGKPLSLEHGAPVRIVMPTKLGYKSAKWINQITVTNDKPGGYWEDQGYDWFGGL